MADILDLDVIDGGYVCTVRQIRDAYQKAHPAWVIVTRDFGDQVYVGNAAGNGLYLDKAPAGEVRTDAAA